VKDLLAATPTSLPQLRKTPQSHEVPITDPTTFTIPIENAPAFLAFSSADIKSLVSPD
jgi:hypothetical protein